MVRSHAGLSRLGALQNMSRGGNALMFDAQGFGAFQGFDPATDALGVIAKVRLAYGAGGIVIKVLPLDWQDMIARALPLTTLYTPDILISPSRGALAKAYRDLGALIDDWANRKYEWAKAGKRDDGSAYSWDRWSDLGKTYMGSITYYTGITVTNGFYANAMTSVQEFVESVRVLFTPTEWPAWAKGAAFVIGLGVLAYAARTFAETGRIMGRDYAPQLRRLRRAVRRRTRATP